jgi:hypothetical protein
MKIAASALAIVLAATVSSTSKTTTTVHAFAPTHVRTPAFGLKSTLVEQFELPSIESEVSLHAE